MVCASGSLWIRDSGYEHGNLSMLATWERDSRCHAVSLLCQYKHLMGTMKKGSVFRASGWSPRPLGAVLWAEGLCGGSPGGGVLCLPRDRKQRCGKGAGSKITVQALRSQYMLALLVKGPHGPVPGTQCITHEPVGTFHIQTFITPVSDHRKTRDNSRGCMGGGVCWRLSVRNV